MLDRVVTAGDEVCTVVRLLGAGEAATEGWIGSPALYPATLLFEALIQAAAPLASQGGQGIRPGAVKHRERTAVGPPGLLLAIRDARMLRPVRFGDRLRITAMITARFAGMVRVSSTAVRDGDAGGPVAAGEFTLAVEGP